ncbi:HAD family hydrolase [Microscilla marina]|uniref:HAD-superfamily hydrolase subfamily IA, variant 3 n=1 Tax=Microscilla marina ATCC 23134 TaxID=313606 RepID=A1ZXM3_MICM2|nr:HAD-IA family hydrolase [Microscilla marina]EAY24898.1 HAD-superfamily hydrolase subfamily IA, variant 3 [Microscilla marina ATCC 23134]
MKLFISDCDGVLIDSEILAAQMMVEHLQTFGVHIGLNDYLRTWSGMTFSSIMNALANQHGFELPPDFVEVITQKHEAYAAAHLQPIAGVKEAYAQIALPKAVVSNSWLWQVKHAVEFVQMQEVFGDRMFSSEMVARPKPAPDIYLHVAAHFGLKPHEIVVVEDSKSGAKAAVDAGMHVVGFAGASHILDDHTDQLYKIGVKTVVSSMADLPKAVEDLRAQV